MGGIIRRIEHWAAPERNARGSPRYVRRTLPDQWRVAGLAATAAGVWIGVDLAAGGGADPEAIPRWLLAAGLVAAGLVAVAVSFRLRARHLAGRRAAQAQAAAAWDAVGWGGIATVAAEWGEAFPAPLGRGQVLPEPGTVLLGWAADHIAPVPVDHPAAKWWVTTRTHTLVVGPTGSGKTRRVLVPMAAAWPGPVVMVSTKPDLARLVGQARPTDGGDRWVWDPASAADLPDDWVRAAWSPLDQITDPDDATLSASWLTRAAGLAATGSGGGMEGFWAGQASTIIAPVLAAVALDGGTMGQVLRKVGDPAGWPAVADRLRTAGPAWGDLAAAIDQEAAAAASEGGRRVDSAVGTARETLRAFGLQMIEQGSTTGQQFSPEAFILGPRWGSLAVVVGVQHASAVAPIVVSLLESIMRACRENPGWSGEGPGVLLVLDEMANTSPLPDLLTHLGEARSHGVTIVGSLQTREQTARWGPEAAAVWGAWPTMLLGPGLPDIDLAQAISRGAGDELVRRWETSRSETATGRIRWGTDSTTWGTSSSTSWEPIMRPEDVIPRPGGSRWRVTVGGRPGPLVDTADTFDRNEGARGPWAAIQTIDTRTLDPEAVPPIPATLAPMGPALRGA